MTVLEVAARRGRALVGGVPVDAPEEPGWGPHPPGRDLPDDLVVALAEWARAADALARAGLPPTASEAVRVSRSGRRLAARASVVLRCPVDFCDPVSGHRIPLRAVTTAPRLPVEPAPGHASALFTEPTPWATGVTLAALVAGIVLLVNLSLALPMATGLGPFGVLIDLVVVAGLVPALWLNRHVAAWRWVVWGAFVGMGLAVVPLLVVGFGGGAGAG